MNATNAAPGGEREGELSRGVTEDVVFFGPEPNEAFSSRDELEQYLAKFPQMLPPGTKIERITPVHEHHEHVRWGLVFRMPDGTEGYRFEAFGEGRDGRLAKLVMFEVTQGYAGR